MLYVQLVYKAFWNVASWLCHFTLLQITRVWLPSSVQWKHYSTIGFD